jgi:hypothetical protein
MKNSQTYDLVGMTWSEQGNLYTNLYVQDIYFTSGTSSALWLEPSLQAWLTCVNQSGSRVTELYSRDALDMSSNVVQIYAGQQINLMPGYIYPAYNTVNIWGNIQEKNDSMTIWLNNDRSGYLKGNYAVKLMTTTLFSNDFLNLESNSNISMTAGYLAHIEGLSFATITAPTIGLTGPTISVDGDTTVTAGHSLYIHAGSLIKMGSSDTTAVTIRNLGGGSEHLQIMARDQLDMSSAYINIYGKAGFNSGAVCELDNDMQFYDSHAKIYAPSAATMNVCADTQISLLSDLVYVQKDIFTTALSADYYSTSSIHGFGPIGVSGTIYYKKVGKLGQCYFSLTGDGTTGGDYVYFTLPTIMQAKYLTESNSACIMDGGAAQSHPGYIKMLADATRILVYKDYALAAFSDTGAKTCAGELFWETKN